MARALISVPKTAKKGEIVEIKAMISHVMETGFRPGADGKTVPRDILRRFICRYAGEEIFRADFYPATAANPFISFSTVATASGQITFTWEGDNGFSQTETMSISVT